MADARRERRMSSPSARSRCFCFSPVRVHNVRIRFEPNTEGWVTILSPGGSCLSPHPRLGYRFFSERLARETGRGGRTNLPPGGSCLYCYPPGGGRLEAAHATVAEVDARHCRSCYSSCSISSMKSC